MVVCGLAGFVGGGVISGGRQTGAEAGRGYLERTGQLPTEEDTETEDTTTPTTPTNPVGVNDADPVDPAPFAFDTGFFNTGDPETDSVERLTMLEEVGLGRRFYLDPTKLLEDGANGLSVMVMLDGEAVAGTVEHHEGRKTIVDGSGKPLGDVLKPGTEIFSALQDEVDIEWRSYRKDLANATTRLEGDMESDAFFKEVEKLRGSKMFARLPDDVRNNVRDLIDKATKARKAAEERDRKAIEQEKQALLPTTAETKAREEKEAKEEAEKEAEAERVERNRQKREAEDKARDEEAVAKIRLESKIKEQKDKEAQEKRDREDAEKARAVPLWKNQVRKIISELTSKKASKKGDGELLEALKAFRKGNTNWKPKQDDVNEKMLADALELNEAHAKFYRKKLELEAKQKQAQESGIVIGSVYSNVRKTEQEFLTARDQLKAEQKKFEESFKKRRAEAKNAAEIQTLKNARARLFKMFTDLQASIEEDARKEAEAKEKKEAEARDKKEAEEKEKKDEEEKAKADEEARRKRFSARVAAAVARVRAKRKAEEEAHEARMDKIAREHEAEKRKAAAEHNRRLREKRRREESQKRFSAKIAAINEKFRKKREAEQAEQAKREAEIDRQYEAEKRKAAAVHNRLLREKRAKDEWEAREAEIERQRKADEKAMEEKREKERKEREAARKKEEERKRKEKEERDKNDRLARERKEMERERKAKYERRIRGIDRSLRLPKHKAVAETAEVLAAVTTHPEKVEAGQVTEKKDLDLLDYAAWMFAGYDTRGEAEVRRRAIAAKLVEGGMKPFHAQIVTQTIKAKGVAMGKTPTDPKAIGKAIFEIDRDIIYYQDKIKELGIQSIKSAKKRKRFHELLETYLLNDEKPPLGGWEDFKKAPLFQDVDPLHQMEMASHINDLFQLFPVLKVWKTTLHFARMHPYNRDNEPGIQHHMFTKLPRRKHEFRERIKRITKELSNFNYREKNLPDAEMDTAIFRDAALVYHMAMSGNRQTFGVEAKALGNLIASRGLSMQELQKHEAKKTLTKHHQAEAEVKSLNAKLFDEIKDKWERENGPLPDDFNTSKEAVDKRNEFYNYRDKIIIAKYKGLPSSSKYEVALRALHGLDVEKSKAESAMAEAQSRIDEHESFGTPEGQKIIKEYLDALFDMATNMIEKDKRARYGSPEALKARAMDDPIILTATEAEVAQEVKALFAADPIFETGAKKDKYVHIAPSAQPPKTLVSSVITKALDIRDSLRSLQSDAGTTVFISQDTPDADIPDTGVDDTAYQEALQELADALDVTVMLARDVVQMAARRRAYVRLEVNKATQSAYTSTDRLGVKTMHSDALGRGNIGSRVITEKLLDSFSDKELRGLLLNRYYYARVRDHARYGGKEKAGASASMYMADQFNEMIEYAKKRLGDDIESVLADDFAKEMQDVDVIKPTDPKLPSFKKQHWAFQLNDKFLDWIGEVGSLGALLGPSAGHVQDLRRLSERMHLTVLNHYLAHINKAIKATEGVGDIKQRVGSLSKALYAQDRMDDALAKMTVPMNTWRSLTSTTSHNFMEDYQTAMASAAYGLHVSSISEAGWVSDPRRGAENYFAKVFTAGLESQQTGRYDSPTVESVLSPKEPGTKVRLPVELSTFKSAVARQAKLRRKVGLVESSDIQGNTSRDMDYLAVDLELSPEEHAEMRALVDLIAPHMRTMIVDKIHTLMSHSSKVKYAGLYWPVGFFKGLNITSVAHGKARALNTLRHEAMHGLIRLGYFTQKEMNELARIANKVDIRKHRPSINTFYETERERAEEEITNLFGFYGAEQGARSLRDPDNPIDIFEKVLSGEIARRGAAYGDPFHDQTLPRDYYLWPNMREEKKTKKKKTGILSFFDAVDASVKGEDRRIWNRLVDKAMAFFSNLADFIIRVVRRNESPVENPNSIQEPYPEPQQLGSSVDEDIDVASAAPVEDDPEVKPEAKPKGPPPTAKTMKFDNPETEKRFKDAMGETPTPSSLERFLDGVKLSWRRATRSMPELQETAYNANFVEGIRKVQASANVGQAKIVEMFRRTMDGLDDFDVKFMTRAIMLKDLYWTAEQGMELPYGFDGLEDVSREMEKASAILEKRPDLAKRIADREEFMEGLRTELVDAGVLDRRNVRNTNYFRHKVIEYAQLKNLGIGGNKLRNPVWHKRDGSEKDISANYFQVEAEMLQKSYMDISTGRFIQEVLRNQYDRLPGYKRKGKEENDRNLSKAIAGDLSANIPDAWKSDRVLALIAAAAQNPANIGALVADLRAAMAEGVKSEIDKAFTGYRKSLHKALPEDRLELDDMSDEDIEAAFGDFLISVEMGAEEGSRFAHEEHLGAAIDNLANEYPASYQDFVRKFSAQFWSKRRTKKGKITLRRLDSNLPAFQEALGKALRKEANAKTAKSLAKAFDKHRKSLPKELRGFIKSDDLDTMWLKELAKVEGPFRRDTLEDVIEKMKENLVKLGSTFANKEVYAKTTHVKVLDNYRKQMGIAIAMMRKEIGKLEPSEREKLIKSLPPDSVFEGPLRAYFAGDPSALDQINMVNLAQWALDSDFPEIALPGGMLMKAISLRRKYIKDVVLGDDYIETRSPTALIAKYGTENDVVWQPDAKDGNERALHMFNAKSIPERMVEVLGEKIDAYYTDVKENPDTAKFDADAMVRIMNSVNSVIVQGGAKEQLVIDSDMAAALNNLRDPVLEDGIQKLAQIATRQWKIWTLLNPSRVLKYTLNNITSDLDAIVGMQPGVLRHMTASFVLLRQVQKGEDHDPQLLEAIERGVLQSGLTEQEIHEIGTMRLDSDGMIQITGKTALGKTGGALINYLERVRRIVMFRENHARLAAYLYYRKRFVEDGATIEEVGYGATKPWVAKGITDKRDLAARMARDLMGDYGAISYTGRQTRNLAIPFWSWMESNTRRYVNRFRNAYLYGRDVSATKGMALGLAGAARMTGQLFMFYAAVQAWNYLFFGDDEEELTPNVRNRLHLNMGRDDDGNLRTLRFQGSLSDFLGWFGMEDAGAVLQEVVKGRAGFEDIATSMVKAPVNKLSSSINPAFGAPVQLAMGKEFYPDLFSPRLMWDPLGFGFRSFSLGDPYTEAAVALGKPIARRPAARRVESLLFYRIDPGESAWSSIRSKAYGYAQRELGKDVAGVATPKAAVVREWRRAITFGDAKVEAMAYKIMREKFGMSRRDIRQTMERADPLSMLTRKEQRLFKATLSPGELRQLELAEKWYNEVFKGAYRRSRRMAA